MRRYRAAHYVTHRYSRAASNRAVVDLDVASTTHVDGTSVPFRPPIEEVQPLQREAATIANMKEYRLALTVNSRALAAARDGYVLVSGAN